MSKMILNCEINDIGNAGMWVSQYVKGLNAGSNRCRTYTNGAVWTSNHYLPDRNTFDATCYNQDSITAQSFLTRSLTYISPEGIRKHALLKEMCFAEDNFEMCAESYCDVKSIRYINECGVKCEASIIPCTSFNTVNSAAYAILVKNQSEIRVTDRLYMLTGGNYQEVVFNFNRQNTVRIGGREQEYVMFNAHDGTEWALNILNNRFSISPKTNTKYKSIVNTIKFMGCALDKITDTSQKNIAMIVPIKN